MSTVRMALAAFASIALQPAGHAQTGYVSPAQKAWQVYGTCLAASMHRSAQADLDAAHAQVRQSGGRRVPTDPARMAVRAREVCASYRADLSQHLLPREFAEQEQAVLAANVAIIRDAQAHWTRQQFFGKTGTAASH